LALRFRGVTRLPAYPSFVMHAYENLATGDSGPRKARVEIIPLIDVVFFLLATFVLFTLSLQRITAVDVNFSKTSTERARNESVVTIQATADGRYLWTEGSDLPLSLDAAELAPKLDHYRRSTPLPRVAIRGEGGAKLGAVVRLIDEVRAARIAEYAVETVGGVAPR
jgi:biopolymer transport protein ExbD